MDIKELVLDTNIDSYFDEPLSKHCSFKIGGLADAFIMPADKEQLATIICALKKNNTRFCVIGNGTNILFDDAGFRGAIVSTQKMSSSSVTGENMTIGSGVSATQVAIKAQNNSLGGAEFLYGIPGTVGGAVYMNAGAFDSQISSIIEKSTDRKSVV